MRMKKAEKMKVKSIVILLLVSVLILSGCTAKKEISRSAVDRRHIDGHSEVYSVSEYRYNPFTGSFALVPTVKTRWIKEAYQIQYEVKWDDDSCTYEWITVSEKEYEEAFR